MTPVTVTQLHLTLKIAGYSDTPLMATVLAVPEGVTLSGNVCISYSNALSIELYSKAQSPMAYLSPTGPIAFI